MSANKKYDLEERTLRYAKDVRKYLRSVPRDVINIEDIKQCTRSSGSIGANYREANDSLSKKDFLMRIKISRKESKETIYRFNLIMCNKNQETERDRLIQEGTELMKIFGSILEKSK